MAGDGVHVHPVIVAVSPGVVEMMISGVVSVVVYGAVVSPQTEFVVGAAGAVASMVTERPLEGALVFPAGSDSV